MSLSERGPKTLPCPEFTYQSSYSSIKSKEQYLLDHGLRPRLVRPHLHSIFFEVCHKSVPQSSLSQIVNTQGRHPDPASNRVPPQLLLELNLALV
jgi:hypothetical protein